MIGRLLAWVESVGLFAALYLGVPAVGLTSDRIARWAPLPPIARWIGILPLLLGAAGIGWSFLLFVRLGHGTPNPWVPPRELVTSGPFAWTRNPIILSHTLAMLGVAMIVASPATVIIVLLLGIPVQYVVRIEERTLEARYGDVYRRYRETVPRWIPRRPRQLR